MVARRPAHVAKAPPLCPKDVGALQFCYHGAEKNIDLIDHDAWNLYQIAKVYLAEYDKLA
jgi:hypothetical protein